MWAGELQSEARPEPASVLLSSSPPQQHNISAIFSYLIIVSSYLGDNERTSPVLSLYPCVVYCFTRSTSCRLSSGELQL